VGPACAGLWRARPRDLPLALSSLPDTDQLRELGGSIDYIIGPAMVNVLCLAEHPGQKHHYLSLSRLGA
jgi:hypothetical protein